MANSEISFHFVSKDVFEEEGRNSISEKYNVFDSDKKMYIYNTYYTLTKA